MKFIPFINFLICFFTTNIIFYWLYLKFSKTIIKLDLSKEIIEKYIDYFYIGFYINLIILVLILLGLTINVFFKVKSTAKKSNITKITENLTMSLNFLNVFYRTYVILFNFVGGEYTQYVLVFAKYCLTFRQKTNKILIYVFSVLPRILVLTIFILESYNEQLHYYFYALLLLLIPLIFKIIIFILKDLGPRVLPELKEMVIQSDFETSPEIIVETTEGIKNCKAIELKLSPEHSDLDLDFLLENYYYPALFIEGHITQNILPLYTKTTKIVLVIYYTITVLGFMYILYINLFG